MPEKQYRIPPKLIRLAGFSLRIQFVKLDIPTRPVYANGLDMDGIDGYGNIGTCF